MALMGQVYSCSNPRCGKRLPADNAAFVGSIVVICGHCNQPTSIVVALPATTSREQC
jgi:hypothetical protein